LRQLLLRRADVVMAQSDIVREFRALFNIIWVDAGIPGLKELSDSVSVLLISPKRSSHYDP
jgi:hypothetical protein